MSERLIDLTLQLKAETLKTYLFADGDKEAWVAKSQCEAELIKGLIYEVTMPEWLAKDKGFI